MSATNMSVNPAPSDAPPALGGPGRRLPAVLVAVVAAALVVSAWGAKDPTTWLLETVWVMVGLPWRSSCGGGSR